MMRSRSGRAICALFACLAAPALVARPAHADAPGSLAQECATQAEKGQTLRRQTRLLEAREMFRACARAQCPAVVAQDCTRWEDEVQSALPTLVIGARDDADRDLTDVSVSIDGRARLERLDGRAVEVDPGPRELVFSRAGLAPLRESIVAREGEKNRLVVVRWPSPTAEAHETPPAPASAPTTPAPAPAPTAPLGEAPSLSPAPRPTPAWVWVLGGAGLAVGGVGAGFAIAANGRYHDLQSSCGTTRTCDESEVSRTRTTLWVADVAMLVGAAAALAATWLIFDAPSARPSTTAR